MVDIYSLISRAQKLREETRLDSVSPDRVGTLLEDTLKYINEYQLLASAPSLHKIYASVSAMQLDGAPQSDLTGKALKPGQLVVIVPESQTDATAGDVYRYDGPSGNTSAWTFVAKIGGVPADADLNASSTNPVQNKVVTEKLTELSEETETIRVEVESQDQLIEDLQNTKIDKENDDYYPKMAVGTADNLAGVDEVARVINFGQSGGGAITDGVARVQSIKGNSVMWNQLVDNTLDTSLLKFRASSGASLSIEDNAFKLAISGTGSQYAYYRTEPFIAHLVAGHKYCVAMEVKASAARTCVVAISGASGVTINKSLSSNMWTRLDVIATISAVSSSITPYLAISLTDAASGDLLYFKNVRVIDLTLMFGKGNEPTTIAELHLPSGVDMSAYNEGEVISMKADGIKSVGRNQWNEQDRELGEITSQGVEISDTSVWRSGYVKVLPNTAYCVTCGNGYKSGMRARFYDANKNFLAASPIVNAGSPFTTPAGAGYLRLTPFVSNVPMDTPICINLSNADINGQYFPYEEVSEDLSLVAKYFPQGMRSVSGAHDEIRYNMATNKWEKVVRIGEADMGDKSISLYNADLNIFTLRIDDMKVATTTGERHTGLLCSRYSMDYDEANPSAVTAMLDKTLMRFSDGRVFLKDSAYTDAASLKASLQGVMLYYELAEPIVTEIEEKDFNLDYKVWNFGTEQMVATEPSAPLAADITYGFNAVGLIKQLRSMIEALSAKVANL